MKRIVVFTMMVCALMLGTTTVEAQKSRSKSRTSKTAKGAKATVAEFKEGNDLYKFYNNGKYDVKNNSYTFDKGLYLLDNGALIFASEGEGRSWVAFDGIMYDLDGLEKEGAIDWNLLPNIISSNSFELAKIMKKGVINFNADTQTVSYNYKGHSGSFTLSQIPKNYRSILTWVKRP